MWRPGFPPQPANKQRGSDIIGQVGDDVERAIDAVRHFQRVTLDHAQLVRKRFGQFGQGGEAARVALDRRDPRPGAQQRAGQAAGSRADLQHLRAV